MAISPSRMCVRALIVCVAVATSAAATGCFWVTTKHEGRKLRSDVEKLDTRMSSKEKHLAAQVDALKKVLAQADKQLKRNSADLGAKVDQLDRELSQVKGLLTKANQYANQARSETAALKKQYEIKVAELQQKILMVEARLLRAEKKSAEPKLTTAVDFYKRGKAAYDGGDYGTARKYFKYVVVKFPGSDRAPYAQYYRAESYFKEKNYAAAIRQFQKVFDKFEKSSMADDAAFRAGEAAEALKRCTEARAYYGHLRRKFPKSSFVKRATKRDKQLRKWRKNKKRCAS